MLIHPDLMCPDKSMLILGTLMNKLLHWALFMLGYGSSVGLRLVLGPLTTPELKKSYINQFNI